MFHSIDECTKFIFQLKASTYKGEPLEGVRLILKELNNPHQHTKFIHFAGSNGKGSTLNATREILMHHGLKVGAFISPHLERVNERITINKEQISDEKFLTYTNQIIGVIECSLEGKNLSFFEIMTVLAFMHFANENVDVALIETGIGGRVDSTNVITPEVSVITTISLEHTDILGDTYTQIAREKAGIIKSNKPVVVGPINKEAFEVVRNTAIKCQSPFYSLGEEIKVHHIYNTIPPTFDYEALGNLMGNVPLIMEGEHQVNNAALAITAARLFDSTITDLTIRNGLKNAKWEGRFEHFGRRIILDGAHNSEGTKALIETLKMNYPQNNYHFVYAALKDKDHQKSIAMMEEVASSMSFTEISLPRAEKARQLASQSKHLKIQIEENWKRLIEGKIERLESDDLLIITGSLYFIAEVRNYLVANIKGKFD